jgi:uncharacterized protein
MKLTLVALTLLFSSALAAQTASKPHQSGDMPKGMKQYFIGFLVQGEKWAQTPPKEELDQLMQKHLAYIRSQAAAGKYALAGPFLDNGRIRGILIINAESAEKARQIVSSDPMVQSGRMSPEIHPAMMADVSCVLTQYNKNTGQ